MTKAKPYAIPKQIVWDAYKKVKANRGAAGVDGQSLADFEKRLEGESLQALESNVVRQLLPASGPSRRDSERQHGPDSTAGHSDRFGSDRSDGREADA